MSRAPSTRLLEFGPPAFAGAAHRAGIVNQQHDGDVARLAVAEPNRPRQRQQQEQNEQGAQEQDQPFAQAPAGVELGIEAMKKHQGRKRARLSFQAEEEMKHDRQRGQRQQRKEKRIKGGEAGHSWPNLACNVSSTGVRVSIKW